MWRSIFAQRAEPLSLSLCTETKLVRQDERRRRHRLKIRTHGKRTKRAAQKGNRAGRARGVDLPWPVVGAEDVPPRGFAFLLVGGRQTVVVLGDGAATVEGGGGGDGVRVGAADGDDDALAAAPLQFVVPRLAPLGRRLLMLKVLEGRAGHGPGALPAAHVVLGRRGGRHEKVGQTLHHFITGARRRCN